MAKTPEQPDEPNAEETAAELARVKEQAQGFGNSIKGLDTAKVTERPHSGSLRELKGLREAVLAEEKKEEKTRLQSVLKNLSSDELIKRTISVAMKDPETVGKVSKKLTEQTKRAPPQPRIERPSPPKKTTPTFSKYAADSGEDTLTMARHIVHSREKKKKKEELTEHDRLMAGLPLAEKVAEKTAPTPPSSPPLPKEKVSIPAFERPAAPPAAPVAEAIPTPPPLPPSPEGANRLDNAAFAEWFSAQDSVKAGNPAEVEKFFSAFEIKEQVKNEVLRVWRERIAKESALAMSEADLGLVANQLETLAKREPEKFVALYGETVKRFTEMPAEIARLEGELQKAGPAPERRYELMGEERNLELAKASNHLFFGFGRLTGIAASLFRTEGLRAEAAARTEIRKDEKYRTIFGGVSAGRPLEGLGLKSGGAVEARLAEIEKIKDAYTKAVGQHPDRAQVEIALARAKKGFQGARAEVFADIGVKKEMSEFLSAKVAETVKQITTPGQITTLADWMKADDWLTGLAERSTDENKLADYLRGFSLEEVKEKISDGITKAIKTTTGEVIATQLEHPRNPGRATALMQALDGAFGDLLVKKRVGGFEGHAALQTVLGQLLLERGRISWDAQRAEKLQDKENLQLKVVYLEDAIARLRSKYLSLTTL